MSKDAQGTGSESEHYYTQGLRTESDKTVATETNRQAGMQRRARDGSSFPVHVHVGQSCCNALQWSAAIVPSSEVSQFVCN